MKTSFLRRSLGLAPLILCFILGGAQGASLKSLSDQLDAAMKKSGDQGALDFYFKNQSDVESTLGKMQASMQWLSFAKKLLDGCRNAGDYRTAIALHRILYSGIPDPIGTKKVSEMREELQLWEQSGNSGSS